MWNCVARFHAATNKSEEFNNYVKWLFFGGEGIIAGNLGHERGEVIKSASW